MASIGIEGASQKSAELARWLPDLRPADAIINPAKELLDARTTEMSRSDGFVSAAGDRTKDSVVGARYVLNAQPDTTVLGAPDGWAEEFQQVVEARFMLEAESPACWLDAKRKLTFTDMVRLAVGCYTLGGEVVATGEWVRQADRPGCTAVSMVHAGRLSNKYDADDTQFMRRGVQLDNWGAPVGYWFRNAHRYEPYAGADPYTWQYVPRFLPWGRPQVLHIFEEMEPGQNRGIAAMVSVLKEMKMTKQYRDTVLQNAVTNASYAAAIESELPSDAVFTAIGQGQQGDASSVLGDYMAQLNAYVGGAGGITMDGVKIPHLFPGTKLSFHPAQPVGDTTFDNRLLRHIATAFGFSFEEFTGDFTQTNYSSAKAAGVLTWRAMQTKKAKAANAMANFIYGLRLEEMIANGDVPLPPGRTRDDFYKPLHREAYCQADWIGASRGQIDEGKETKAAVERVTNNLSTYEDELGRLGKDWRKVFAQQAREKKLLESLGLQQIKAAK